MGLRKACALQVDTPSVDCTLLNKAVEIPVHLPQLASLPTSTACQFDPFNNFTENASLTKCIKHMNWCRTTIEPCTAAHLCRETRSTLPSGVPTLATT